MFSLVIRPLFIGGTIAYYELNIEYITEKFCENKDKPQLQCNGKCHLAKELSIVDASPVNDMSNDVKLVDSYKLFAPVYFKQIKNTSLLGNIKDDLHSKVSGHYSNLYTYATFSSLLRPPIV